MDGGMGWWMAEWQMAEWGGGWQNEVGRLIESGMLSLPP